MKKWIAGLIVILGLSASVHAVDSVCLNDPNCLGDKVVLANSTPSFFMLITTNGIQFGDGTTQTTAGGAGGGGAAFFTFTDNSGNKTAISSMTFPTSLFNRLVTGSSITVLLNPSSVTLLGQNIPAANIADGSLGANVMASSIAANTVKAENVVDGSLTAAKFQAGAITSSSTLLSSGVGFSSVTAGSNVTLTNTGGVLSIAATASGGSGGGTTSSTMVVVQGGTNGNAQNIISFQDNTSTNAYVDSNGVWRFGKNASRHLIISTNAWQSIGTTAPESPFHVFPNPTDGNNAGILAIFDSRAMSSSNSGRVVFRGPSSPTGGFVLGFGGTTFENTINYVQDITGAGYRYFSFGVGSQTDILSIRHNRRVGINTVSPDAILQVSSAAGTSNPMLIVSTGTTKLFEVTGTSVNFLVQPYLYGLPITTGVVSPALQGGTSDPLYVASGSIANLTSTGSVKAQLVSATAYHLIGSGAGQLSSPAGEIQVDANGDGTTDIKLNVSSIQINGVAVSTDQANTTRVANNMTFDTTLAGNVIITTISYGLPGPVYFSSTTVLQTTITLGGFGEAIFTHNDTTFTNKVGLRAFQIRSNNPAQEFTFHFVEHATGTVRGNRHYVITIATASNNGGAYSTITPKLPIAFTVTTPIDGPGTTITDVTTTGWSNLVGPGGCLVFIGVGRDNGTNHTLDSSDNPTLTGPYALTGGFRQ